ncbi:MAG: fumarate reductase cytochrome b subunit [Thiovulaceae bacterium]|nr:fumarate reductase cytochrome b subunit [Sulfurimonadaceae bacterium]
MDRELTRVEEVKMTYGVKKSRTPAKLDYIQSATGLTLALFMWGHMMLVSSILLGEEAMYTVTKFLEGQFVFGESYPLLVSGAAGFIFIVFIAHAAVAIRKFPGSFKEYRIYRAHMKRMKHSDTNLWFYQVFTAFVMFFLGSVHLYIIMTNPSEIGPYASADRIVSEWMAPLYILLLLAVEFHGSIGLYRLAIKWGWFEGKDAKKSRKRLKVYKWFITVFFLVLGFLSLAAYIKIGISHQDKVGERYVPTSIERGVH